MGGGYTPIAAAVTLFFLFALRTAERVAELSQQQPKLQPAAPHAAPETAPAPISMPAALLTPEQLSSLPVHARPLSQDEARLLWRPESGAWLSSHVASPVASAPPTRRSLLGTPSS